MYCKPSSFRPHLHPLTLRQTCNIPFQPSSTTYLYVIHDYLRKFSDPSQHRVYLSPSLSPRLSLHFRLSSPHRPQNLHLPSLRPVKCADVNRAQTSERSSSPPTAHVIDRSDIVHSFAQRLGRFYLVVFLWHPLFDKLVCTGGETTRRSSNRRA